MASHFQEAMQEKKETKSSQACFLQAQYDIKGNERMSDFFYQSIILYLMTILRYDDDTIHRHGCLFGAPAIRIIIIRGDLQPSLGNSDHKSLFSPYQNEHVGSM